MLNILENSRSQWVDVVEDLVESQSASVAKFDEIRRPHVNVVYMQAANRPEIRLVRVCRGSRR